MGYNQHMTQQEEILVQLNCLNMLRNSGQWNNILQNRYDELIVMKKLMEGIE